MARRAAALAVIVAGLAAVGAVGRLARPRDPDALAAAALSLHAGEGGPALIVVVDPTCPACDDALRELRDLVRPRELGLAVRVVPADGAGRELLAAAGPGLVPVFVVTDPEGRPVAMVRGPRQAVWIREWLERSAARALADPLDPGTKGRRP